jgi:metallo-beta-lactamase class B
MFDNLYYVGLQSIASFVITTNQGLILVDPTFDYTAPLVLDSIKKLGFNPRDIKYMLISHGHADHSSGAKLAKDATGAMAVMAEGDCGMYEDPKAPYAKIPREVVAKTGDSVTLGDTTIRFCLTPGHTPGCLTMQFFVYDNGKPYKALIPGGLGFPNDIDKLKLYAKSVETAQSISDVRVRLPDHTFMYNFWERAQKLQARNPTTDPNPFVDSHEVIVNWWGTLHNGVLANVFFLGKQPQSKPASGGKE